MKKNNFLILIVDDEPDLLEIVEFQVESLGFSSIKASNGIEALELINKNDVDIVISDIQMPGGDGLELIKAVKSMFPKKPEFIFISGLIDSNRREIISAGAFEYLEKPAPFESVKETIERAILKIQETRE